MQGNHRNRTLQSRGLVLFAVCAGLVAISGCGGLIKPTGRIVENGGPVKLEKGYRLAVTLYPADKDPAEADPFIGTVDPDNTFYVVGRKNTGIPPDKYQVTIALVKGDSERDHWNGKYGREKSPFIFDLREHRGEMLVDLADAQAE